MSQIKISNLSFTYEGSYIPVFEHVSLQLDSNWKLGFTGRNGRGKTTFLKLLAGEYVYTGSISASIQFSYFPFTITEPYTLVLELLEELAPTAEQWQIRKLHTGGNGSGICVFTGQQLQKRCLATPVAPGKSKFPV